MGTKEWYQAQLDAEWLKKHPAGSPNDIWAGKTRDESLGTTYAKNGFQSPYTSESDWTKGGLVPNGVYTSNSDWTPPTNSQNVGTSQTQQSQTGGASSPWAGAGQLNQLLNQTPAAPATTAPSAPAGNQFSDAMSQYLNKAAPTAPTGNSFTGAMTQYLGQGAPTAPTSNSFADPMKQYLASAAPVADKATMGTNRYAAGLSTAEQRLQDLITNPGALEQSAAYKFRFNQGQEALNRSLGAKGMLNSGNRLTELTKYGQDMGSQEYEAENARRLADLNSYSGNYNSDELADSDRFKAESSANNTRYQTDVDLYGKRGIALADLYKGENTSNNLRYATDVDLYGKRGTTLADLYGTETKANTDKYATDMDAYGRQGLTLSNLYSSDNTANTSRHATDVGAASDIYGIDVRATTDRAKTLADLYKTDKTNELGWAENEIKRRQAMGLPMQFGGTMAPNGSIYAHQTPVGSKRV